MKKFLALMLTLIIATLMPCTVFAEDYDMSYMQNSTLKYTAQGNFMIYIPMEITVGETVEIRAEEINIPQNKQIRVSFGGLNSNNAIEIYNESSPTDKLTVKFRNSNGEDILYSDLMLGKFTADSSGSTISFSSYVTDDAMAKAGDYTGNLEFYIGYEDLT